MALFKKRNNPNPKAENKPSDVFDFGYSSSPVTGTNGNVFAKIDRIASQVAMLSYGIYSGTGSSRKQLTKHPLLDVIRRPSLEDMHFLFFYMSTVDYYHGGIFWKIARGTKGQIVSLFRLDPNRVTLARDVNNIRIFRYGGKVYYSDEIVYIPSRFDYSTLTGGTSIFKAAQGAFETSKKLDNYTNSAFDKGINGQRLLIDISEELPGATEQQINELRNKYNADYAGPENAGKPLFKKNKINYSYIGNQTDNRAATLIENRQFQESEISNIFGYPDKKDNLELFYTFLLEDAVRPIATQIQEAINLLFDSGDDAYFEFNYNSLLKVSLTQRIDAYTKQLGSGQLSINEIRAKENLPPVEEGDTIFVPVNYMPWNKETKDAYMAKQKLTAQGIKDTEQHIPQGDDKQ